MLIDNMIDSNVSYTGFSRDNAKFTNPWGKEENQNNVGILKILNASHIKDYLLLNMSILFCVKIDLKN